MIKTITADELNTKLQNDEVLLIDVREPEEHQDECISEACLIPLAEISHEKIPTTALPIVIHCRSGGRSAEACRRLLAQDPTLDVSSLEGGIIAWKNSGYDVKV